MFERGCSDLYGAGEPLGETAPPPRTRTAAGGLREDEVEDAVGRTRVRAEVGELSDDARERLVGGLLDQLSADREQLPEELRERLLDGMVDELIAGKRGEAEILGSGGVLGELTRRLVERALSEELSEHLGYPAGHAPPGGAGNSRNGGSPKTLLTDHGSVRIAAPRDRGGSFEPQLVKKNQRRVAGLDEKIIALYAGGMTTREIETYISDLYGPGVSRETVSRVTASVLEDAKAWQTRPLEQIYPILYLDALMIKIRDGQAVRNFACYLAIGVNLEGDRDVLGMWFLENRGRQVLAAGALRAQPARRLRRARLLRRRADRLPRRDRGCLPSDLGANMRGAPDPLVIAVRALQRQEEGRLRPAQDLHGGRPRPRRVRARSVRRDLGSQVSDDLRLVDRALGAHRAVPLIPARRPPSGLHHKHDRGAQPPNPEDHQDSRQLPGRGLRPQTALPRHHPRAAQMAPHLQLELSPDRVPDPLRRPHT